MDYRKISEGMFCSKALLVLVVIATTFRKVQTAYTAAMETEIRSETVLHASYDPVSRPKSQTHVKTGLNILAIDELNLKDQKLTMAGWLTFEWEDKRLTWNKTAKDDIEYIFTKPDYIWKPEVVIDNSLADLEIVSSKGLNLRLKYDGTVEWEPLKLIQVHCEDLGRMFVFVNAIFPGFPETNIPKKMFLIKVDVTYYPYDQQKCAVEIVSWAYTYDEVVLDHLFTTVNLEDFVHSHFGTLTKGHGRNMVQDNSTIGKSIPVPKRHGEWRISHTEVEDKKLTEHIPDGSVRTYPQLDFWVFLQRRTEFYYLNVMMPIILTSLMVVFVFIVPIDSGEKVSYVLTLFLSLAVLLTIVAGSLPPTSITISVLGLYLGIVLILTAVAILLTVCIIILYHKEGEPAKDSVIMNLTSLAAKVTCLCAPVSKTDSADTDKPVEPSPPLSNMGSLANLKITSPKDIKNIPTDNDKRNQSGYHVTAEYYMTWKDVATILDRFCFITFSVLTVAMNISFVIALTVGGKSTGF